MAECVVALLRGDTARAIEQLWADLEAHGGSRRGHRTGPPHVTLTIIHGAGHTPVLSPIVAELADATPSFRVPGAGYGLFIGHDHDHPVLHLPLTRTPALDDLHRSLVERITSVGLEVDGQTAPEHWRPHITLADTGLDPATVGSTMSYLVTRSPHRWSFAIETLALLTASPDAAFEARLSAKN